MLLTGCARQQKQTEYRTVTVPCLPIPAELTAPITKPAIPDTFTYGDSVMLNAELFGLLNQANIDRRTIRNIEAQEK
ncbi:hypothetical protein GCM10009414_28740 [Tatumella terrea]|uniref:Rz1-like lysis system protein LysC n=1 Tax=Tatumella terrea TaxID=419007 RepID=UPI00337DC838